MKKEKSSVSVFQRRGAVMLLGSLCALSWAGAFPSIKIGLREFQIAGDDIWAKTLFAGVRFFLAGVVVLCLARLMGRKLVIREKSELGLLLSLGLVNTALHYFCFYLGLSSLPGSRSAILDAMSTFITIGLSCVCFRDDRLTLKKVLGCILGFGGILLIYTGSGDLLSGLSLMGDGMMLCSSLCFAVGGILTRIITRKTDPIVTTGISLAFGGVLLIAVGFGLGGRITACSPLGLGILTVLIGISSLSFTIFNQLLRFNKVSSIAIFNALIPILGVILCCAFLGEPFAMKYIVAGVVVAAGVVVVNLEE